MKTAIIYGASKGGEIALEVFRQLYHIVCFVDKDPSKHGTSLNGIPVVDLESNTSLLYQHVVIVGTSYTDAHRYVSDLQDVKYIPFEVVQDMYYQKTGYTNYYNSLPKHNLQFKHLSDCRLLPSREDMVRLFPVGGVVAEVGVFKGDFSRKILDIAKPKKLYLIDIWSNDDEKYNNVLARFSFEIAAGIVEVVRGDSSESLKKFPDKFFDWIYIDSHHDYEIPKNELNISKNKIKNDGIIAGDDYIKWDYIGNQPYGVVEAVNEFCSNNGWKFIYFTLENHGFHNFALKKIQ